jgi:predicted nucleic acid-binding protein
VAVAVFDADVLIAYLSKDDAHHVAAVEVVRRALAPGTRRLTSAVNYTELLIGPLRRAGAAGVAAVDDMLDDLGIEAIPVNRALAGRAAAVRVQSGLKLPDAYALATALAAREQRARDVRLESFDIKVLKVYAALESPSSENA